MKGAQILHGEIAGYEVAALLVDGALRDLFVDSPHPRPGAIYRAKAIRPVKGMGGMFFETSEGSAFLRGAKGISTGDFHLVQVSGYAEPGKAIPVTTKLSFKGRYSIVIPDGGGIQISRLIKDEERRVALREAVAGVEQELDGFGSVSYTHLTLPTTSRV